MSQALKTLLGKVRTIALVGASPKPDRASYQVMAYMLDRRFKVIPINPNPDLKEILGQPVVPSLADLPGPVDMVDVFRRSEFVREVYEAARPSLAGRKVFWTQIGVRDDAVAQEAQAAGIEVIQDRCPKIEYQRLFGELSKAGINTRVISSKLPIL